MIGHITSNQKEKITRIIYYEFQVKKEDKTILPALIKLQDIC